MAISVDKTYTLYPSNEHGSPLKIEDVRRQDGLDREPDNTVDVPLTADEARELRAMLGVVLDCATPAEIAFIEDAT